MFGAQGLVSRNTQTNGLSSASTLWYAFDERGNVSQRTGGNGAVLSTDLYDGFGKQRSGAADVFGFGGQAGYYTDVETGLILCTNRHYDPQQGRFLTRDPLGYGGGINLYSYTGNNPVNRMDPDGTDSLDNAIMAVAITSGGIEGGIQGGALGAAGGTLLEPGGGTLVGGAAGVYAGAGFGAAIGAGVGGLVVAARHGIMNMANGNRQTPRRQVGPPRPGAPNGQPRRIFRRCPTPKRAEDMARQNGNGPPDHDPAKINEDGEYEPGHYHATQKVPGGYERVPDGVHWQYPPFDLE